jgi:DNA-binding SARP family transcriptional activator/tetratricopeptide (TPR) repeat protein
MLRVAAFGELTVELDGEQLPRMRSRRARSLFAWMALNPGLHPRSRLAGLFWPDVLEESARMSLRTTLATLRRELGARAATCVVASRESVGIPPSPEVWVDVVAFDELVREGRLKEALGLCRGELLADLDDDWVFELRDARRHRVAEVLARLADEAEELGDLQAAVDWTRKLVALEPLAEAGQRELIRRLALAGDRSSALAAFDALRARFRRDFQAEPSAETRALAAEIRSGVAPTGVGGVTIQRPSAVALPTFFSRPDPVPIVGRRAELDALRASWRRSLRGDPHVVVVEGQAGSGKSRLVSELARELHAAGTTVLAGRAHEQGLGSYQPLAEALGQYVRSVGPEAIPARTARELVRILPEVAERNGELGGAPEGDPAGARFRLFESVASLLAAAAEEVPLTLALEDLHWADPSAVLLVGHIVRTLPSARLFVVGTVREEEPVPPELEAMLVELRREQRLERIELPDLSESAVRELVSAVLGVEAPAGFAAAVHRRTGGNPFYGLELVRHLLDSGAVALADNAVLVGPAVEEAGLPEGVRAVIERRVSKLSQLAQQVLAMAAALGDEFRLVELDTVIDAPEEALVEALDEAIAARLIEEEAAGEFRFSHVLVREAVYARLTATRRALLHRRIAEALVSLLGDRAGPQLADLARHFRAAGDRERAAAYAARAGDWALAQLAYEDAAAHFEDALDSAAAAWSSAAQRARLLLAKGNALLRAGRPDEARTSFGAAAEEARSLGDGGLLAEAALGLAGIAVTIMPPRKDVLAVLEEALAALDPASPLRARLLARIAIEVYYQPPVERRERLSAEAVETAAAGGDPAALLEALNARHVALWGPDHLEERLRFANELVERARISGDRERELQGLNWRVVDLVELADLPGARLAIEAHESLADELRLPAYRWYGPLWRSMLCQLAGKVEEAEELTREGAAIGRLAQDENAAVLVDVQRAAASFHRGAVDDELLAIVDGRGGDSPAGAAWRTSLAFFYAELGRLEEARAELQRASAAPESLPRDANWLFTMSALGVTAGLLADAARAEPLYELLLPYAGRVVCTGRATDIDGASSYSLGLLAAALGRFGEAEEHFEGALRLNEAIGAPPLVARTKLRYAELLERRRSRSDVERAAELREGALAAAQRLGMRGLVRQLSSEA